MSNNKRAIMLESLQTAKTRCGAVAAVSSRLSSRALASCRVFNPISPSLLRRIKRLRRVGAALLLALLLQLLLG